MYTLISLGTYGEGKWEAYFNTLYDYFYIGGLRSETWTNFKILVDLFVKLNTTRPLQQRVQRDIMRLQNIRFLIVDFRVFISDPVRVWAKFPKLESIVIGITPYATIQNYEETSFELCRKFYFIRPRRGTKYAKRVPGWRHVQKRLHKLKTDELPH